MMLLLEKIMMIYLNHKVFRRFSSSLSCSQPPILVTTILKLTLQDFHIHRFSNLEKENYMHERSTFAYILHIWTIIIPEERIFALTKKKILISTTAENREKWASHADVRLIVYLCLFVHVAFLRLWKQPTSILNVFPSLLSCRTSASQ